MLKLEVARAIVRRSLEEARRLELAPLAVTVLDAGGNLVCFEREDGAGIARADISFAKAWGSLGMGFGSRELAERSRQNPTFITILASVTSGRVAPSPGGILIADGSGSIVGAVGVSGDTGDQDEACALAGIASVGLRDADRNLGS
jgi:uncharacterized protein GlcG (DUF336 family)